MSGINVSPLSYIKIIHHAYKHLAVNVFGFVIGKYNDQDNISQIVDVIPVSHNNKGEIIVPQFEILFEWVEKYLISKNLSIVGIYYGDYKFQSRFTKPTQTSQSNEESQENQSNSGGNDETTSNVKQNNTSNTTNTTNDNENFLNIQDFNSKDLSDDFSELSVTNLPNPIKLFLAQLKRNHLFVWLIDNEKLSKNHQEICFQQFESNDGGKNWFTEWNTDLSYSAKTYKWNFSYNSQAFSEKHVCEISQIFNNNETSYLNIVDLQDHLDNVNLDWRNLQYNSYIKI